MMPKWSVKEIDIDKIFLKIILKMLELTNYEIEYSYDL